MVSVWTSEGNAAVLFEGFSLFYLFSTLIIFCFFFLPLLAT